MAKEQAPKKNDAKKSEPAPAAGAEASKGKSPMKLFMVVGLVMVLEVATVGLTMMFSGGPKTAEGHTVKPDTKAEEENKLVELQVVRDQFPNQQTGRTYLYDTEIWLVVRAKDSDKVKKMVESMQATLATDIAVLFRRAAPAQLLEPTLATLTRQVKAALDERIGRDADDKPIVQEALIKKCIQFRTDG